MENKMQDMFNEIISLRSTLASNPPATSLNPQFNISTSPHFQPASPVSPVSQHSTYLPVFAQGSSNAPLPNANYPIDQVVRPQISHPNYAPSPRLEESSHQVITPDPSPQLTSLETSTPSSSSGLHPKGKRRRKSVRLSDDGNSSSSSSSDSSQPRKRSNHHDTRCYTIQVSFSFIFWHKV